MKSIEMVSETYGGIPADAQAFTPADESVWFDSKDIQCLPAILATLKGLRALVVITDITLSETAVSLVAGEDKFVSSTYKPVEAFQSVIWKSSNDGIATVETSDDGISARLIGVKAGTAKVTATGGGKTATITVTVA